MRESQREKGKDKCVNRDRLDFLVAWRAGCIANRFLNETAIRDLRKRSCSEDRRRGQ